MLEYHTKNGSSVLNAWDISSGVIKRSSKLDKRGPISIIVDAIKEKHMREAAESEIWPFAIEGQGSERFASLCANQKSDHLLRTALESQGSISLPVPPQYFGRVFRLLCFLFTLTMKQSYVLILRCIRLVRLMC